MAKRIKKIEDTLPKVASIDNSDRNESEFTLMSALEKIVLVSEDSNLVEEEMEPADAALSYVCSRSGLSKIQAIMFAICLNQSYNTSITIRDIQKWIGCPLISLLKHQNQLDALLQIGLLAPGFDSGKCYAVPGDVVTMLNNNEIDSMTNQKNLSFGEFFNKMGEFFLMRRQSWNFNQLSIAIKHLVDDNPQLSYCKRIMSLPKLEDVDIVLLHYFCHRLVNHNDSGIDKQKLDGILDQRIALAKAVRLLSKETHPLSKLGLVEIASELGFAGELMFTLSNKARKEILVEADVELIDTPQSISSNELIPYNKITEKSLYYNKAVADNISRLSSLISEEKFAFICSRLENHGLRKGFACLFYGAPGTGKTETVLQLARITGRDIMRVDISEMRSKWVGESQKMVKSLFDRYRRAVNSSKIAPILLFNEADAILTMRNPSCESSVDKMENAMQNIFLQEIESLEGILIATTNLTDNLDPAFERRFLYKVEFFQPDADCRALIWQSMIADLTPDEAALLADNFNFSGGQIENISRKYLVDNVLYGQPSNKMAAIKAFCQAETIHNRSATKIGFAF